MHFSPRQLLPPAAAAPGFATYRYDASILSAALFADVRKHDIDVHDVDTVNERRRQLLDTGAQTTDHARRIFW
jgi:hypothetical protein